MKNYYTDYKTQIQAIAKLKDVDGCTGGRPALDVACDIFDNNAKVVIEGKGVFVECGVPKTNQAFWEKAYREQKAVPSRSVRHRMQVQFAAQFRK